MTGTGPAWWLDERAHAGDEHLDTAYVAGYDRKAGFDPTEDVEVLRRHGLGPASVVVDLGAGTGTFTAAVAPRCGRVVAVDVSPPMAAALRARARDLGLANVTVVEAGFLTYEHEGPPADAVYTRNALHQVPDFWKAVALDRIAGLLRPGGVLRLRDLVYDFGPAEAEPRIEAWLAGAVDDPAVGWTAAELAHHVRTEFSTYAWLLEPMLDRCGFDVVERSFRRGTYGAYTCRRR
ncbi:MAG TPA: class I SAM-dependent methyltransferase [Acidimicrobiales bacterium]|nr:class I SAM-dependent methyltransferase [Acidimicrobiales bacterium]